MLFYNLNIHLDKQQVDASSKMAFILGVGCKISDTSGPISMKLWGSIELTPRFSNVIFLTSGRKSKPEVSLPHAISVLFRYEILPGDRENDLQSNEPCTDIGRPEIPVKTGFS